MHELLPLFISILLLIVLLLFKLDLGWSLLLSSGVLTLFSGMGPVEVINIVKNTVTDTYFLEIIGIILLINLLEELLREGDAFERALQTLQGIFKNRAKITAVFPALLGSIPAFGGARLSAPMVDMAAKDLSINDVEKSHLNYWFRHIWEFGSPLFPGVILAIFLSGVEMWKYILIMLPFNVIAVTLGYIFFLRPVIKKNNQNAQENGVVDSKSSYEVFNNRRKVMRSLGKLVSILWPIFVILSTVLIFKVSVLWPLLISDLILLWQNIKNKVSFDGFVKKVLSFKLLWMVVGIFLFKTTFEQTGLPQVIPPLLTNAGIPSFALIIIFPFIIGLLTGMLNGFVGITYPLLVPIFYQGGVIHLGALVLAFIAGHVGTMLSPLHFCFVLTVEYFKTEIRPFWTKLLCPEIIMLLLALGWAMILGLPA